MELICPTCGSPNGATGLSCWKCHTVLSQVPAPGPDTSASRPAAAPETVCPDPACGELNAADARTCDYCGTPLNDTGPAAFPDDDGSLAAELLFADGTVITLLDGHTVVLGREAPDGRVAGALARAGGVSRQHASVQLIAGALVVEDQSSMNGTYVDDVPVAPALTVPLRTVSLRLGQNYELRITATERNGNG